MSFIDYLETNLTTSRASGGSQVVIHDDCPFCGASGGRIYVDVKKGLGIDHKCGQGFSAIKFIMAHEGVNYAKAVKLLGGEGDRYVSEPEDPKERPKWWPETIPLTGEATAYMQGRGFSLDFCRKMGLLYCPSNTKDEEGKTHWTAGRVIIPISNAAGEYIGWQGRDITGNSRIKYLIQPGFDARESLYNINRVTPGKPVLVVEGVMDAWGWIRAGVENVVATWGKKISRKQVEMLAALPPSAVLVAWDGDASANRYSFAEDYGHIFDILLVPMGDKDADELSVRELSLLISRSKRYSWEDKISSAIKT